MSRPFISSGHFWGSHSENVGAGIMLARCCLESDALDHHPAGRARRSAKVRVASAGEPPQAREMCGWSLRRVGAMWASARGSRSPARPARESARCRLPGKRSACRRDRARGCPQGCELRPRRENAGKVQRIGARNRDEALIRCAPHRAQRGHGPGQRELLAREARDEASAPDLAARLELAIDTQEITPIWEAMTPRAPASA